MVETVFPALEKYLEEHYQRDHALDPIYDEYGSVFFGIIQNYRPARNFARHKKHDVLVVARCQEEDTIGIPYVHKIDTSSPKMEKTMTTYIIIITS